MAYNTLISHADALAIMPTEQRMEIIKATLDKSYAMQLCRKLRDMSAATTTLKVSSEIAKGGFVTAPTGDNHGGLINSTTAAWEDVVMTAEKIATFVVIDQDTIDDGQVDIFSDVKEQISADFAAIFDGAVLAGTNAPSSWPTGGIVTHATSAGNSVSLGTGSDLYDDLLDTGGVFSLVEADGYGVTGCVAAMGMKARLRGVRDGSTGLPIFNRVPGQGMDYELDGAPCYFPKHGAFPTASAHLIAGDFSQAVWAMRKDIEFKVFTEGVVTDNTGAVVVNLMETDAVVLRATMRLGFALPNPINQLQPTKASRSPFAVLAPASGS